MKTYNCEVRLGGNMLHTVPKRGVTQKELALLKHIHGSDSLVGISEVGETNVSDAQEHLRLARAYNVKAVRECFNVSLDNFDEWLQEQLYVEEEVRESRENDRKITLANSKKQPAAAGATA